MAGDCAGQPPKHLIGPLSGFIGNADRLKTWYRNCTEVRDSQGAERIVLTAVESGMPDEELSSMIMTAATDHFYMDAGHLLDFHNKAFEAAELADTSLKKSIFASLTPLFSNAVRSEELHSWQAPVNLVTPLKDAFQKVDGLSFPEDPVPFNEKELLKVILSDQPITMIDALTETFKNGASPVKVARIVSLAAAERIVRFHIQNDFNDWITVLHTFTHAHAVHESLRRTNEPALIRAVYHAAVSVYLDRFLNIPSTKRPVGQREDEPLKADDFLKILDIQQQVNEAGQWAANYLHQSKDTDALFNTLGHALLREDADFHSYQMYEAASREFDLWSGDEEGNALAEYAQETMIIAAARYLAAHAPTAREIPRVGKIAWRLHYGEKLFEDNES
ncbi:Rieske (2Fe-2S) protein [Salipaludibacillus sp. CUR1]|uniref:Rieske (2Fe-2S) protein n=1 Tax=Salipaludibacillus sp. CUR1 TaxID=2820003 RepID=UPI00351D7355